MKFSILIPSHPSRQIFDSTLQSAELAAKHVDAEIIIVRKDQSLGANINEAFAKSTGQWIKILPDDDEIPEMALSEAKEAILSTGIVSVLLGIAENFGLETGEYTSRFFGYQEFLYQNTIHGSSILYNRDAFKLCKWAEDIRTGEEREFHLRLFRSLYPATILHTNILLGRYRIHENQKGHFAKKGSNYRNERLEYLEKVINGPFRMMFGKKFKE